MVFGPHSLSPAELAAMVAAERRGAAFLAYRDGAAQLVLRSLEGVGRLRIGRLAPNDVVLDWDAQASRAHAELELRGGVWTLVDDGLSRNGSFVNGERVSGRRRLADGDVLRMGSTTMLFREPYQAPGETAAAADRAALVELTPAERRVLVALCRPFATPGPGATPASDREIAARLSISTEGVRSRMRALFAKLEIAELPQNRKRAELARRALETGLVTRRDLTD